MKLTNKLSEILSDPKMRFQMDIGTIYLLDAAIRHQVEVNAAKAGEDEFLIGKSNGNGRFPNNKIIEGAEGSRL